METANGHPQRVRTFEDWGCLSLSLLWRVLDCKSVERVSAWTASSNEEAQGVILLLFEIRGDRGDSRPAAGVCTFTDGWAIFIFGCKQHACEVRVRYFYWWQCAKLSGWRLMPGLQLSRAVFVSKVKGFIKFYFYFYLLFEAQIQMWMWRPRIWVNPDVPLLRCSPCSSVRHTSNNQSHYTVPTKPHTRATERSHISAPPQQGGQTPLGLKVNPCVMPFKFTYIYS